MNGRSKLVNCTAEKLSAIPDAVKENNAPMEGVAKESREQVSAIDEVNSAVRQIDEMAQHNAALVEAINAAIEQTEGQTTDVDSVVNIFKLAAGAGESADAGTHKAEEPAPEQSTQKKVVSGARALLTQGSAAISEDWKAL